MEPVQIKKPMLEDMPELMVKLINKIDSLESRFIELEKRFELMKDKGTLLKGYNGIKAHYKFGTDKINKMVAQGAPIHKVGRTLQCYTNELDDFIAKANMA